MQVQFAEKDRAGILQASGNFGVGFRNSILEELAGARRSNACGIDVVFQGDGHSVQRPAPSASLYFRFGFAGSSSA